MKRLILENNNILPEGDSWAIPINSKIVSIELAKSLPDIREEAKVGDVVFGVWFTGGFDAYLLKVEDGGRDGLGVGANETWYGLNEAYFVFSYEDYKKLDPYFDMKLEMDRETRKFNL